MDDLHVSDPNPGFPPIVQEHMKMRRRVITYIDPQHTGGKSSDHGHGLTLVQSLHLINRRI